MATTPLPNQYEQSEESPRQIEAPALSQPKPKLSKKDTQSKIESPYPGSALTSGVGFAITKFFKQVGGASLKGEQAKPKRRESVHEELWREMNTKLSIRKQRMEKFRRSVKTIGIVTPVLK